MARGRRETAPRAPYPVEQEAFLNVVRAADWLTRGSAELLKAHSLTGAQYNVLRILRGSGPDGLPCKEVAERMITREPDVTRLLDRMEKRGLISRARSEEDRRVVVTRITRTGLDLLSDLDLPIAELHRSQFAHLERAQLADLNRLLDLVRRGEP
jgi:DNA-binding MarR family transcriptional regulator